MLKTKSEIQTKENAFFNKRFKFSYSGLNTLLTSPRAFYNDYVMDNRTKSFGKHLLEGTLIHFLILEDNNFDDHFTVTPGSLPSSTNLELAEALYKMALDNVTDSLDNGVYAEINTDLSHYRSDILQHLIAIDKHQSLKDTKDGKGDDKRMAKVCDQRTLDYFQFLCEAEGKTIIDSEMLARCKDRSDIVKTNKEISALMGLEIISDQTKVMVYNELYVTCKMPNLPFDFHGTIDNLVVDLEAKKVYINDLKTSGKSLVDFEDSVEFYNYWLQASMYIKLTKHFLKDVLDESWEIEFRFVVFDKYNQLYPFKVRNSTLESWKEKTNKALTEAIWHYENRDFNLPYNYATGKVNL